MTARNAAWWADRTAYQIYPRSFADGNGDGVGDLPGIIARLDHLAWLGIGVLWLSPIYASPMIDNGYDIADYRAIAPEFGTMADFDRLLAEARSRDIAVVMDLVVNHSSDHHAWFQDARADRDARYRDFYYWRDPGPGGGLPSELRSAFGGPAWSFDEASGQYYLHLFAPQQPDLNWHNAELRAEIYDMMNWWLDKGVAGFRMDVINFIGKDLEKGAILEGPHVHRFLQEMHAETLAGRDALTIGETWHVTTETALKYSGRDRNELSMVFQFEHITQGQDEGRGKWATAPFDLIAFKAVWDRWQAALAENGWNALFLSNHDLPRQVSAYGDPGVHRAASAKMLATVMHLMKGTPFVYQGEELGLPNARFGDIREVRDVEIKNHWREARAAGDPPADIMERINAVGRDVGRTPVPWTDGPQAGFTSGTPWIKVDPAHVPLNAENQRGDPDSVLAFYRRLIALRPRHPVIVNGSYVSYLTDHPSVWAYVRELDGVRLAVLASFASDMIDVDLPPEMQIGGECLICNRAPRHRFDPQVRLGPFEAVAILDR